MHYQWTRFETRTVFAKRFPIYWTENVCIAHFHKIFQFVLREIYVRSPLKLFRELQLTSYSSVFYLATDWMSEESCFDFPQTE